MKRNERTKATTKAEPARPTAAAPEQHCLAGWAHVQLLHPHERVGGNDRRGNGNGRDECCAPVADEEQDNQRSEEATQHQVLLNRLVGTVASNVNVRAFSSSEGLIRLITPENVLPGYASTDSVTGWFRPSVKPETIRASKSPLARLCSADRRFWRSAAVDVAACGELAEKTLP